MYGCGNTNLVIWTVGHSTLSFQEFFEFLAGHRIERLADVRRFPASQRVPWATKQVLAAALRDRGIDYEHFEDLGGFANLWSTAATPAGEMRGFEDTQTTCRRRNSAWDWTASFGSRDKGVPPSCAPRWCLGNAIAP